MRLRFSGGAYGPFLLPRRWRRCFYCSCALVHRSCFPAHGPFPDNLATLDHVFPRSRLSEFVSIPSEAWFRLNRVAACARCNADKGALLPGEWLAILPHREARHRLSARLYALTLATAGTTGASTALRPIERRLRS